MSRARVITGELMCNEWDRGDITQARPSCELPWISTIWPTIINHSFTNFVEAFSLDDSYQIVQADANIFGETYGRYHKFWFFGGQTRRLDTWSPRWHSVPLQHKCMNSYGTDWDWDSGRWSQISMWHPWHSLPWLLFETSCESQIRISTQFTLRPKWKAEIE